MALANADDDRSSPDVLPDDTVAPEEVHRLARLARLTFSDEEAEALSGDLTRLLGFAQQLGEVDVDGIEPLPPGGGASRRRLRKDDSEKPLAPSEALDDAPDEDNGFFRVPGALR